MKQEEIKKINVKTDTIVITYETYTETVDNDYIGKQYVDIVTNPELSLIHKTIPIPKTHYGVTGSI